MANQSFKIPKNIKKLNKKKERRNILLLDQKTPFAITEAYKTARTNIIFSLNDQTGKSITMTSCWPLEGKTTTCVNLAITFAETGSRVLLIDADLRKPRIAKIFKIQSENGLSNVLKGFCPFEDAVQKSGYANLDILTSGHIPPNPAELLSSGEMRGLLEKLSGQYDYIFIDTPPVNLITDAAVISNLTSGTILVVREEQSDHRSIESALEKLKFANANLLGFMLNDVSRKKGGSYGYRYWYGYRKKYKNYDYAEYIYENDDDL